MCVCVCTPFLFDLSGGRIVSLLFSCPKLLPHATSVGFFFGFVFLNFEVVLAL